MALIKCTDCQKEISDKADSCPHCGCPAAHIVGSVAELAIRAEKEREAREIANQAKREAAEAERKERESAERAKREAVKQEKAAASKVLATRVIVICWSVMVMIILFIFIFVLPPLPKPDTGNSARVKSAPSETKTKRTDSLCDPGVYYGRACREACYDDHKCVYEKQRVRGHPCYCHLNQ